VVWAAAASPVDVPVPAGVESDESPHAPSAMAIVTAAMASSADLKART
jgi:hypothetical protein